MAALALALAANISEANEMVRNGKMMVFVNGNNICEHVCHESSGHTVRNKEHFEGLLQEVMKQNRMRHEMRLKTLTMKAPEVEQRPLVEYEIFSGCDDNE